MGVVCWGLIVNVCGFGLLMCVLFIKVVFFWCVLCVGVVLLMCVSCVGVGLLMYVLVSGC